MQKKRVKHQKNKAQELALYDCRINYLENKRYSRNKIELNLKNPVGQNYTYYQGAKFA